MTVEEILRLLKSCTEAQRQQVFEHLRSEFPIHPIEQRLGARAELILEAFHRGGEFTFRMMRGVVAEAAFAERVLPLLTDWSETSIAGDPPFDFQLTNPPREVRIQIKLQRSKGGSPLLANTMRRFKSAPNTAYVVETQKSRRGTRDGRSTREYRFGAVDILAVSLWPSTNDWSSFRYAATQQLLPERWDNLSAPDDTILKFQPVLMEAGEVWTDDIEVVIERAFDETGLPTLAIELNN